jgi:cytochrome c553
MRPTAPAVLLVLSLLASGRAAAGPADEFFERRVRPVLVKRCYSCHSATAKKLRGGLRVDSRAALLAGGDSGPAVVPGAPEKSKLIEAVLYTNVDMQMPPRGKLAAAEIADLAAWVKAGAAWPGAAAAAAGASTGFDLQKRKREHWAWKPVAPAPPPAVHDARWARTPIDRFLLARLEGSGLAPAKPAGRLTLLRRLSFDLVGLPPSPAEMDAFLNDRSPEAVPRLVDRLLASPRFGERWGRHWLDLVRYAESRGHEFDFPIPNAYQYRDYVIRAINADVPYDQFVLEHVAGDLLPSPRRNPREGFNESVLGTGFWFLGEEVHSPVDVRADQADRFDNRIDVLTKTFLGLTVACARCHDHKFDAISTKDYYSLFGFLSSSSYRQVRFDALPDNPKLLPRVDALRRQAAPAVRRALAESVQAGVARTADYLLAAREAMAATGDATQRVEAAAARHKLDGKRLARWVAHLRQAARDAHDPLHAWALVAAEPGRKPALALVPLLARWRREAAAPQPAHVAVDFGKLPAGGWLPDDVAFGAGPVRPGDLTLTGAGAVHFVDHPAAARLDPLWASQRLAPGSENEPGALGSMLRSGRTIRTPSFRLTHDRLFYLVRGAGMAYASAGAHVMIAGPLHGRLVRHFPASEGFRWVEQELSIYKGQQLAVEFTASSPNFAVCLVVQADRAPGPYTPPNAELLRLAASAGAAEEVAQAYQQLLLGTTKRLAGDGLAGSADHARLANFLARQAHLFTAEAGAAKLDAAVAALRAGEAGLAAKARLTSRLAPALLDGTPVDEQVFIRGSHKAPGAAAPRRFLEALAGPQPIAAGQGSGRLELARLMVDPARNPFIARVMVNRLWHHLFGRGIVASVDNFGVLGERPTHPELLDHLAGQFVQEGWSVKKMIRALVLTRAYQMASDRTPADAADPGNALLHRMPVRRLEGEAVRDALLCLSGRLDQRLYGPSVPVHLTAFQDGRGRPGSGPLDGAGRRSVYLAVRRNFLSPMLLAFDTPSPFSTVGRRTVSNVPAQSLILMNDPFVHDQARLWARRTLARAGSPGDRLTRMYRAAYGRPPSADEQAACLGFLGQRSAGNDLDAWADLAHALVNVKEFIFLQ